MDLTPSISKVENHMTNEIIKFLRKKDYEFVKKLDRGGCGETVLLFDDIINEQFVCKKYAPFHDEHKEELFKNFIQEIKLLHLLHHKNIVRVFNYYIYPEILSGYILMEFIEGFDIEEYLEKFPEKTNEIFLQTISGFVYLEDKNILHRDVRPQNILVTEDGIVKIIDFGFGKQIIDINDFKKSISLNWWCELPPEFNDSIYDFQTELYFIGKLFEKIIKEKKIEHFKYTRALNGMCKHSKDERFQSFSEISNNILSEKFTEIEFNYQERDTYQKFSKNLCEAVVRIAEGTKYYNDATDVLSELVELNRRVMLEDFLPSPQPLTKCFINGEYFFSKKEPFPVEVLKKFIDFLKSCSNEKLNIVFSNLHTKLDSIERYLPDESPNNDIPF
jgi:eukaryotic-like serine/threonine-protein kinase